VRPRDACRLRRMPAHEHGTGQASQPDVTDAAQGPIWRATRDRLLNRGDCHAAARRPALAGALRRPRERARCDRSSLYNCCDRASEPWRPRWVRRATRAPHMRSSPDGAVTRRPSSSTGAVRVDPARGRHGAQALDPRMCDAIENCRSSERQPERRPGKARRGSMTSDGLGLAGRRAPHPSSVRRRHHLEPRLRMAARDTNRALRDAHPPGCGHAPFRVQSRDCTMALMPTMSHRRCRGNAVRLPDRAEPWRAAKVACAPHRNSIATNADGPAWLALRPLPDALQSWVRRRIDGADHTHIHSLHLPSAPADRLPVPVTEATIETPRGPAGEHAHAPAGRGDCPSPG
jgi:hypothetical protein